MPDSPEGCDGPGSRSVGPVLAARAVPAYDDVLARADPLSAVLDSLADVVFLTDAAGNWTYLNEAWTTLTGFSARETLGTNFLDYVHPDEREHTVALFMAVISGGGDRCHHTTRYITKDGAARWSTCARVIRDGTGTVIANSGTITDLTGRRAAEDVVVEHEHVLELISDAAQGGELPLGSLVFSHDLVVERSSPLAQRVVGAAADVGAPIDRLTTVLVAQADGPICTGRGGWSRPLGAPGASAYGSRSTTSGPATPRSPTCAISRCTA